MTDSAKNGRFEKVRGSLRQAGFSSRPPHHWTQAVKHAAAQTSQQQLGLNLESIPQRISVHFYRAMLEFAETTVCT